MMMSEDSSLKSRSIRGIWGSAIERFSVQGVTFLLNIIIARLVAPQEYGLIAMLGIFIAVAQLFVDSGFSNALIQKKERGEVDFSTAFYFNVVVALIIYGLMWVSAPWVASFYNQPLLEPIMRWVSLSIILSSFAVVQRAKLTIALDFTTQAKASLIAVLISGGVGVYMAYYGYGVWALVAQSLLNTLLNTVLLWFFARWRPSLIYSWESFRALFSFGSRYLLSGLIHVIYMNLYTLVIGKRYAPADVGFYNRASTIVQFPSSNISVIISRAMYPAMCEIQDEAERLATYFTRILRMSCYIIFPMMMGMAAIAEPLISVVLTDKWLPAVPLLQILALAYMWYPVMNINGVILTVKGRTDYFLRAEIIKKSIAILILIITLPMGLKALCWGLVFYNCIDMATLILFSRKVVDTGYWHQLKSVMPTAILSWVMVCVVMAVMALFDSDIIKIVVGAMTGVIFYVGVSLVLRFEELTSLIELIKNRGNE